jgi:hypothetical protein
MASHTDKTSGQVTCVADVSPEVVDAGAKLTLQCEVSCAPACDLRGHALLIKDETGSDRGRMELTGFDGKTNQTGEFIVKAPVKVGGYKWLGVCPAVVKEGISYGEVSIPISFTVKPHTTSVVAWDTPSAVVVGERFKTKVGIKCSSECHLENSHFGIYNHNGDQVASVMLTGELLPGTTGLYFAEVELQAPAEEGLYTWSVKRPGSDAGIPHDQGSVDFGVRVVSQSEYVVKVETVDKVSQTPLSGARVVMHPYRAVTDERGVAEVRVAKGAYKLFVSQTRYITFGEPLEVTADITARAELELEPVLERN